MQRAAQDRDLMTEVQNGHAERLVGSIRRKCLDHVVILGEAHLRRVLATYADYYNELRAHGSLTKDAPLHSHC
jgi:Integrase core domain